MKRIQNMARSNYTGEAASTEASAESDKTYAEQPSRLQGQWGTAMDMTTENTIDSEQNETR